MQIPGLKIDDYVVATLMDELEAEGWSQKFRDEFRRIGPQYILDKLKKLIVDLDNTSRLMTTDEYHGYIQCRDSVVLIERVLPYSVWECFAKQVSEFDSQLRSRWKKGQTVFNVVNLDKSVYWWYFDGLPNNVV